MHSLRQKLYFLHVDVISYLPIATIFAYFVEGMAPVNTTNFEEYPSIANRDTVRRFITVQINCTKYENVNDGNSHYTLYKEYTCSGGWIFRNSSTQAAKIQPSSYTSLQVTDLKFDYLQTVTQNFQQIYAQWQMCVIRKIPPTKAEKPPRRCLFFS